ncbi:copper resistance CopC family protein [Actinomadura rudentiformis]|uniref:copper resistance CopC family protein n=1 Tax=Actinomadura rudentiformis TaxID=359158 RepID=UPI00178C22AB|nr:copper resistance CopC family protein [Actinomadura rudentiformis]
MIHHSAALGLPQPGRLRTTAARLGLHGTLRALAAVLAAAATVPLVAPSADAHAELKSITPEHKSVQTASPNQVVLTFNQPVNSQFTVIRVTGPDGARADSGSALVGRAVVRQGLMPLTKPGAYQVAYRTVSVDGHVISGAREFTFKPGPVAPQPSAASAPAGSVPTPTQTQRPGEQSSSGFSWGLILLGAVGAAVVAAAAMSFRRGRRRAR